MNFFARLFGSRKKKPAPRVAPVIVAPAAPLTMGVSVYCGWAAQRPEFGAVPGTQCPNEFPWKVLQTNDRNMALGKYDERDPAITRQRCDWMASAGIDFACYQVEWAHAHTQPDRLAPWTPRLSDPLLMSHCADNHPADSPVRFCVSLWDVMASAGDRGNYWQELREHGWGLAEIEASWRLYARTVAQRYMTRPNYLTVDGRPVMFHGYVHSMEFYREQFGLTPSRIVALIREEVRAVTGRDPYLVATATEKPVRPMLKLWGFNALTEYLLYSSDWPGVVNIYRQWRKEDLALCRDTGLDYWVPATAGYDSRAWGSPVADRFIPTAAEFTAHLKEARAFAAANMGITRGFVCSYAFDETGEGGIIEPMQPGQLHDGDEMLRAHRAACLT